MHTIFSLRFLTCLACMLISSRMALAESYVFRQMDVQDGLSDNKVYAIFKDAEGFLWFRTEAFMNRYDGVSFRHFHQPSDLRSDLTTNTNIHYASNPTGLIFATNNENLAIFDPKTESFLPNVQGFFQEMGFHDAVRMVFIDEQKRYWIRTDAESLYYQEEVSGEWIRVLDGSNRYWMQQGYVQCLTLIDQNAWILTDAGMLLCFDMETKNIVFEDDYLLGRNLNDFSRRLGSVRMTVRADDKGNLFVQHDKGVLYFETTTKEWTDLFPEYADNYNLFTCMEMDLYGNVWVGTGQEGFFVIHQENRAIEHHPTITLGYDQSIRSDISSIFMDRDGGVWMGTTFSGVCYYHPGLNKFAQQRIASTTLGPTGPYKNVKCFSEFQDGRIFVGTVDGGYLFDSKNGQYESMPSLNLDSKDGYNVMIQSQIDSNNRLWIATLYHGLICYDKGAVRVFKPDPQEPSTIPESNIRSVLIDSKQRMWVAPINFGVGLFNPDNGHFERLIDRYPEMVTHKHIPSMCEMPNGDILFCSTKGFFKLDASTNRFVFNDSKLLSISSNLAQINNAYVDSRGLLWVCTQDGLCMYDMRRDRFRILHVEDGLPNNCVQAIEEDSKGILWISTYKGLSKLEVELVGQYYRTHFVNFTDYDGLQGNSFNFHAHLKASDGRLYFGGFAGFNYFFPETVRVFEADVNPVITELSLFNKPVMLNQKYNGRVLLSEAINKIQRLKLKYNENFIALDFSALNYLEPAQTVYRYRLEGVDENWVELRSKRGRAAYTDLNPGTYTFYLQASNIGAEWGDAYTQLMIQISPPFWKSLYANVFYLILLMTSLVLFVRFLRIRHQRRLEEDTLKERGRQKEELDQMKFQFFTNISHEFRTPLTLIMTPLDNLIRNLGHTIPLDVHGLRQQLAPIQRNAQTLLSLVNQLLDFRKIEVSGEHLLLAQGDMVEFAHIVCSEFTESARLRNIYLYFETPEKSAIMAFDKDKMQKIFNNILSNALKYTSESGFIRIELWKENGSDSEIGDLMMRFSDSGMGIDPEDLPFIFERFYQSKHKDASDQQGSGIGLHLVREYVKLHQGEVRVESVLGKGTVFTVRIPMNLASEEMLLNTNNEQHSQEVVDEKLHPAMGSALKRLLLVEDNEEFRLFLKEQLAHHYQIIEARDGMEAFDFAVDKQPDLIVSDLMMPKRDGLELCKMLKADLRTSHIPVIILTARSADEYKLSGYEVGADYYLTKPFHLDLLLLRIASLVEHQEERQKLFQKTIDVEPSAITVNTLDEKLIKDALKLIEDHMSDTEFSVDELASELGMSRGHLYRKLVAITGKSPIEFMRLMRLKRAAQLLRDGKMSVNDVTYMVGFNNPKYFRKYFKEAFGLSPSQYADNPIDTNAN